MMPDTVSRRLAALPRPILIAAVGNRLKADDGAGPAVADLLKEHGMPPSHVIDCGASPENFTRELASHSEGTVLFCDAAHFNGNPGSVTLIPCKDIAPGGIFTHGGSLDMLASFLAMQTSAQFWLLGIQPGVMTLNDPLSPPVRQAVSDTAGRLLQIIKDDNHA